MPGPAGNEFPRAGGDRLVSSTAAMRRIIEDQPCEMVTMWGRPPPSSSDLSGALSTEADITSQVQSYVATFSSSLSQKTALFFNRQEACTFPASFACYLEEPDPGCKPPLTALRTSGLLLPRDKLDFSFALDEPVMRNMTKPWLSSQLISHLLTPSPKTVDHVCSVRRSLGWQASGKCKLPSKVMGVHVHIRQPHSSMKTYVSSIMRLLSYSGARYLLLVPTNLPSHTLSDGADPLIRMNHLCNTSLSAVRSALKKTRNDNFGVPPTQGNLAGVRVACLSPLMSGSLTLTHR